MTDQPEPPPPSRRDHPSPAASQHGLLHDVNAWCTRTLRAPRRLPPLDTDVDDIAVERACRGDRTITLNRAEMDAAFRTLQRRGRSVAAIAATLGVTPRTVIRWRQGHTQPYPRRTIGVLAARRGLAA